MSTIHKQGLPQWLRGKESSCTRSQDWEDALEKEMATHSSILAWEIPRTEEPGGLQYMGPKRVGHDLGTKQQQQQILNKWSEIKINTQLEKQTMSNIAGSLFLSPITPPCLPPQDTIFPIILF